MKHIRLPSVEEISKRYTYCKETGEFAHRSSGKVVVSTNGRPKGIRINYSRYLMHRLIWKLVTGDDPGDNEIDHINRNELDNRWSNLRLATRKENSCNKTATGITKDKRTGKWRATIQVERKKRHISVHECPLMAHIAYVDMSRELRGEFSPV